jgi:hypothetical protein
MEKTGIVLLNEIRNYLKGNWIPRNFQSKRLRREYDFAHEKHYGVCPHLDLIKNCGKFVDLSQFQLYELIYFCGFLENYNGSQYSFLRIPFRACEIICFILKIKNDNSLETRRLIKEMQKYVVGLDPNPFFYWHEGMICELAPKLFKIPRLESYHH